MLVLLVLACLSAISFNGHRAFTLMAFLCNFLGDEVSLLLRFPLHWYRLHTA